MGRDSSSFIRNLLRSLPDGQFYAANILQQVQGVTNDTNIYRIFSMYAGEFVSGSAVLDQLRSNLNLSSCSIDLLWNNFGCYLGPQKMFEQDWETDLYPLSSGSIIGYRKQLRFMMDAMLAGSSLYAVTRVCQAFTGMAPISRLYSQHPRWKLKLDGGEIGSTSGDRMVDEAKSWIPNEWTDSLLQVPSSSLVGTPSLYDVTDSGQNWLQSIGLDMSSFEGGPTPHQYYLVTFTKLGHNTKLYSREVMYDTLELHVWLPSWVSADRREDFIDALDTVKPADGRIRVKYETKYMAITTVAQFSSWSFYPGSFTVNSNGSISNLVSTLA